MKRLFSRPSTLTNKRYLLTGASRGIGELALRELIALDAVVIAIARNEGQLTLLKEELGEKVICAPCDLTKVDQLNEWAERLWENYGPFDGLIHNAGVDAFQSMSTMSPKVIIEQINLNLTAPTLINRALLPKLISWGQPSVIIHMSSVAGYIPTPFGSIYSATKSALTIYSQSLAIELDESPVRFMTLHPGFVNGTGMHEEHKLIAGSAPLMLGGTSAKRVIQSLLDALHHGSGTRVINMFPIKPLAMLTILAPRFTQWLSRKLTYPYLSLVARADQAKHHQK